MALASAILVLNACAVGRMLTAGYTPPPLVEGLSTEDYSEELEQPISGRNIRNGISLENYKGDFVHPQKWPKNLKLDNKKVIVIGSGATAVTIVPKIAETVSHVTMLQRSPTYVGALPNKDVIAKFLKFILPKKIAHKTIRIKNVLLDMAFFNACRIKGKRILLKYIFCLSDLVFMPLYAPRFLARLAILY